MLKTTSTGFPKIIIVAIVKIMKLGVFLKEHIDFLIYCIFGAMATAVNMLSYHVLYNITGVANTLAALLSWFLAVTFAFFTNKFFVFRSKEKRAGKVISELLMFYTSRAGTGVLDVAIMYIAVDLLSYPANLWKFIANLIVGVINYLAGKLLIFKHKL